MTVFRLPTEPTADTVWTQDTETGTPVRWNRVSADLWARPGVDATGGFTWQDLLARGSVFDRHPDLIGLPRTPWRYGVNGQIVDDNGCVVRADSHSLVIRAVNEYAARLEAGPTAEDRTVSEGEIERLFAAALAEKATGTAVRALVHYWRGVTSVERRDELEAACGGVVEYLDALVRARSSAGE